MGIYFALNCTENFFNSIKKKKKCKKKKFKKLFFFFYKSMFFSEIMKSSQVWRVWVSVSYKEASRRKMKSFSNCLSTRTILKTTRWIKQVRTSEDQWRNNYNYFLFIYFVLFVLFYLLIILFYLFYLFIKIFFYWFYVLFYFIFI